MGVIDFYSEQSEFILSDQLKHSDWLVELIAHHGFKCGDLSIIFCSDDYLLNMNIEHLDHDYYTDVITFNYVHGEVINGDIFISVDRVEDNAKEFHCNFAEELRRVMAHGLLHLLGFDDKDEASIAAMRKGESHALKMYK